MHAALGVANERQQIELLPHRARNQALATPLIQNKLTLGDPFCLDKITPDELILAGALASQAANDDMIDLAVLGGLKDKQALKPYQVTHFTPFDPVHKRTEAAVKDADGKTSPRVQRA